MIVFQYGYSLVHNLFLFEKFLLKKRYVLYIIGFCSIIALDFLFTKLCFVFLEKEVYTIGLTVNRAIFIYMGLAVYLAAKYYRQKSQMTNLVLLQKENELNELKAQLNPHFLYNSLNNIYSHLLVNNDETGRELVLKLSELMRHITEDSQKEKVSLIDSLKFIENYITFEKERLGKRCTINLVVDIDNPSLSLAPHIIFPLVENAFKHGTNSIGSVKIDISAITKGEMFYFKVQNGIYPSPHKKSTRKGLYNVKRRLEILYPGKHNISIKNNQTTYEIDLEINLS